MPTSNVIVTSASLNSAGQLICIVCPTADLWLKELIIVPYPNLPLPIGVLKPGTQTNPVVRQIFVDANDPVFHTPAPFVLALTYDAGYKLTAPLAIVAQGAIQPVLPPFNFAPVANFSAEEAAIFVVQALAAAAPLLNPLETGSGIAPLGVAAQMLPGNGHTANAHKNGKEKHHHPKP